MQCRLSKLTYAACLLVSALLPVSGCATTTEGSIGAVLAHSRKDGRLRVLRSPAASSVPVDLAPGDEILLIDGRDVRRMTDEQVHEALVGPAGSTVRLTTWRAGRILRVEAPRYKPNDGARTSLFRSACL